MSNPLQTSSRDRAAQLFADAELEADVMQQVVREITLDSTEAKSLSSFLNRSGAAGNATGQPGGSPASPDDLENLRDSLPRFANAGASSLLQRAADQWQRTNALAAARLDSHYRKLAETELAAAHANATNAEPQPPRWMRPGTILDEHGIPIRD